MTEVIHIGNKVEFGIDIQIVDPSNYQGYAQMFVKSKPIGSWDDIVSLAAFHNALLRIKDLTDVTFIKKHKDSLGERKIFNQLNKSKVLDHLLLGFPENFDDFILRVFKFENNVYFLWEIVNKPFFEYPAKSGEIFYEKIEWQGFNAAERMLAHKLRLKKS
jgi:hypothetical protein